MRRLWILLGLVSLPGCDKKGGAPTVGESVAVPSVPGVKTPAGELVAAYLTRDNCTERMKLVVDPVRNEPIMREFWAKAQVQGCNAHPASIDDSDCSSLAPGRACGVLAKYEAGAEHWYAVVATAAGPKIDWRASIPYNRTALITFKATKPPLPSIFRLQARISDYYNYEFRGREKRALSIDLQDYETRDDIHGYVVRDAEDGKRALAALSDGRQHPVMVKLAYLPNSESSSVAAAEFLQEGWLQNDAEFGPAVPASSK